MMNATTIQSSQNDLIRQILGIEDAEVLKRIKNYIAKTAKKVQFRTQPLEQEIDESVPDLTKEELMADLNAMCEQIKLVRAGKLKGTPWEEFRHELL